MSCIETTKNFKQKKVGVVKAAFLLFANLCFSPLRKNWSYRFSLKNERHVKQNNYLISTKFYEISPKETREKLDENRHFPPHICNNQVIRKKIRQDCYLSMRQR